MTQILIQYGKYNFNIIFILFGCIIINRNMKSIVGRIGWYCILLVILIHVINILVN